MIDVSIAQKTDINHDLFLYNRKYREAGEMRKKLRRIFKHKNRYKELECMNVWMMTNYIYMEREKEKNNMSYYFILFIYTYYTD